MAFSNASLNDLIGKIERDVANTASIDIPKQEAETGLQTAKFADKRNVLSELLRQNKPQVSAPDSSASQA